MADLELEESYLRAAALLLTDAASILRDNRPLPMLDPETYTGIGPIIGDFMRATGMAAEALSDAAGVAAVSVTDLMNTSTAVEAEISRALGPGFTN